MTTKERIASRIEQWPIARLKPYERNSKIHSAAQVAQIAESIRRFGFNNPVLTDASGSIIAGHGRHAAALKLGLASVPVIVLDHLTDAERRAYVIADNKLAESAKWDDDMLAAELAALNDEEFDLGGIGFSDRELEKMLRSDDDDDGRADECPPAPEVAIARRGDLWQLGRHRLLCGDSTDAGDVARLMDGATPHLMIADPPYGVMLDQSWRDTACSASLAPGNRNRVASDDRADWTETWAHFGGDVAYVWHADKFDAVLRRGLESTGFELVQQIVWNKSVMVMGRSDYQRKHEPCWYAVRKGKPHRWTGDRSQVTVWDAAPPNHIMGGSTEEKTPHPTQKPVVLYEIPIANHTGRGECVYDPFGGSGTLAIACEQTGRDARLMEIEPKYCDVIIRRWEEFTGGAATLDGDGRAFAAIAEERRAADAAAAVSV